MKFRPYGVECDHNSIIDGLGYITHQYIRKPMLDSVPYFNIKLFGSNKTVSICYMDNKYADPNNKNRLTDKECEILNNWTKERPYPDEDNFTNWDNLVCGTHIPQPWWDIVRDASQPDYSVIKEPDDVTHCYYEIPKHSQYFNIREESFGTIINYGIEEEDLFQRPHFHIITHDGRNVEICLFQNRYANPNNPNTLTSIELEELCKWMKDKSNLGFLRRCWDGVIDCYDDRCTIPASAKQCSDYSTILPAEPFVEYDMKYNPRIIGECDHVGKILVFEKDNGIQWWNNSFWIAKMEELIPIGICHSVYYDHSSKRLSAKERKLLADWMESKINTSFGKFTRWDYTMMTYEMLTGNVLKYKKIPNYRNIHVSKDALK